MIEQRASDFAAGERVGVVVIHGVGETEPGWINDDLVAHLAKRPDEPRGLEFAPYSEVYPLPDRGRRRKNATFKAYLRRGEVADGPKVALIECFWADLSRIGAGPISGFVSLMRLFYEAPQVLGKAALAHSNTGLSLAIKTLILFANWILRWPITGTNTAALMVAVAVLALQRLPGLEDVLGIESVIPYVVAGVLILLIPPAIWLGRRQKDRDIALSDIATSTAYASFFLLVLVGVGNAFYPVLAEDFDFYLSTFAQITLLLWFFWTHAVALAILLLFALAVGRLFWRRSPRLYVINRPAAALALTTIQGVIWKIGVALPWLLLLEGLSPDSFNPDLCKGGAQKLTMTCTLQDFNNDLLNVILFNIAMVLALAVGFAFVALARVAARYVSKGAPRLPRLVVSPIIVILMFALTLFNAYSFYGDFYASLVQSQFHLKFDLPIEPYRFVEERVVSIVEVAKALTFLGGATAAIFLFFRLFRAVQNASRGLMHIVRDLVDHQYSPELAASTVFQMKKPPPPAQGGSPGDRYPRRNRIEHRLDTLMRDVVSRQRYDRLLFVAHSQGTVILYDYFRSQRDEASIDGVKRIDMLTLASPLTHLYRYYFEHYDQIVGPRHLNAKLMSWINIWRLDDPIGSRVDTVDEGFIDNELLVDGGGRPERGGHLAYWREERVREALLSLIDPARTGGAARPISRGDMAAE